MPSSAAPPPRLSDLPAGAVVATSSLRRQAQVKHLRPDLAVVPMRGNVETRLRKIDEGVADATLLAMAGLKRLGLEARAAAPVPVEEMLPAVAQGAIGVETRADDEPMAELLAAINHEPTALAVTAERAFLAKLEGSCRMPIAALAELQGRPPAVPRHDPHARWTRRLCHAPRRPAGGSGSARGRRCRRATGPSRPRLPARDTSLELVGDFTPSDR